MHEFDQINLVLVKLFFNNSVLGMDVRCGSLIRIRFNNESCDVFTIYTVLSTHSQFTKYTILHFEHLRIGSDRYKPDV